MKPKEDPLKPLFDALQHDAEPIDAEREKRTLNRFLRERIMQPVEDDPLTFVPENPAVPSDDIASPAVSWKSAWREHRRSVVHFDKNGNRVIVEAPDDDNNKLPDVPPQHRPEKRK